MIDPAHAGATAWSERHVLAIPAWHPAEWLSVLHCTQAQNHSAADEREPLDLRSNSAAVRQRKPSLGDAARLYLDAKSTQIRPQAQSGTPRSLFASIRVLDQLDVRPIAGTEGGLNPFFFARWPISRFFHLSGAQTRSDGRWSSYDDLLRRSARLMPTSAARAGARTTRSCSRNHRSGCCRFLRRAASP